VALKQTDAATSLMAADTTGGYLEDFSAIFILLTVVFCVVVIAGVCILAYAFVSRQRLRELVVRERIAMIEKGLVPPPEVDPLRFERLVSPGRHRANSRAIRYRSAGIVLMGLGLAMILLLTFAADSGGVGLGVGGGLAVLGAAVFLNGMLVVRDEPDDLSAAVLEHRRPEPPPNVGP
jgi:hypothetical protein